MASGVDLSIIISTFNRCELLPRTIDSVLKQSAPGVNYEVLVVDNNSSDHTRAVLEAYQARGDPRFRHFFEGRQGVSFGRNTGIANARGEVLAFTDDDLFVPEDWVAKIADAIARHPEVEYVGGRVLPVGDDFPAWLTPDHWSPLALFDYGPEERYVDLQNAICLGSGNSAFRRSVFGKIAPFSPDFPRSQDHELQLRLWNSGGRGLYVPDIVVFTEVPSDRLTKKYHRSWYYTNGRYVAMMRADDVERSSARLFDIPAHVFRQAVIDGLGVIGATLVGKPELAFRHEARVRFAAGFCRQRKADFSRSHRTSLPAEVGRFLRDLYRR